MAGMKAPKAVILDFDGTLSTLRCGWESVMRTLMGEILGKWLTMEEIDRFIDESTGIQTIFQMKWIAEQVSLHGGEALDPWDYKAEYNRRLMENIEKKKQELTAGRAQPEEYRMAGSEEFLKMLIRRGAKLYVASGTDQPDVQAEAKALGLAGYFEEIAGAPLHEEKCSKEAVLRRLMAGFGVPAEEILVIGDGKVEIALGREAGTRTLGVASNERARRGIDEVKVNRLTKAGADRIVGDYTDIEDLEQWIFGEGKES